MTREARAVPTRRVLLCTPDARLGQVARETLGARGFQVQVVSEAATALRRLATTSPELLAVSARLEDRDGVWLLRRIHEDYMGTRPKTVLIARPEEMTEGPPVGADAVLLGHVSPETIVKMLATMEPPGSQLLRGAAMKELVKLSVLESDLEKASRDLMRRLVLAFRATDGIFVGSVGDRQFVGVAHGPVDESPEAPLWDHTTAALECGTAVWVPVQDSPVGTIVAVPVQSSGGNAVGVIVLLHDRPRIYAQDDIEVLSFLGERLYAELAWRAVHERIAADRERLRESSLLDPLLGVWTRAALDQNLASEISAAQRRKEPLSVAILDVRGLRRLNERHGHAVGDLSLQHVARLLRGRLRTSDRVARFAGNTLALVMAGTSSEDAYRVVERLQLEIESTPLHHEGLALTLSLTGGVAGLAGPADSGEAALARAAGAATRAKAQRVPLAMASEQQEDNALAAEAEGLEAGVTLGGMYQIMHEISRGAMGVVYRAEDLGLGRPVALKTLRPDLARDENFIERFRVEAATMAQLRHENLAQVYTFGTDGDDVYFVMELVEGEPLEDRIDALRAEGRMLSLDLVVRSIQQAADALGTMHAAGILHRDVKPANILIDRVHDRAVVVDFGIAKRRDSAEDPAGTPGFTAPESFQGGEEGPAADVYGLAATAYALLTTSAPFGSDSVEGILARQVTGPPPLPSSLRPALPASCDALLVAALDPEPGPRPATVAAFATKLAAALAEAAPNVRAGLDMGAPGPEQLDDDSISIDLPAEALGQVSSGAGTQVRASAPGPEPRFTLRPVLERHSRVPGTVTDAAVAMTEPMSRGILFRSASRVLGSQEGASWVASMARRDPAIANVLQPQSTMLSWHPTVTFVSMLRAIAEGGRDGRSVARELGRVAAAATFSRFFGAEPRSLSPWKVVSVAGDTFWPRYHSWGQVSVDRDGEHGAHVSIEHAPASPLLAASVAGIFEQAVLLAGAPRCQVELDESGGALKFALSWSA